MEANRDKYQRAFESLMLSPFRVLLLGAGPRLLERAPFTEPPCGCLRTGS